MKRFTLLASALALAGTVHAEAVLYDFQDFNGDILGVGGVPAKLSASRFDVGSPWGGVCLNLDLGNTNNFACGGFGSSVANFTVSAQAGYRFDVNSLTFEGYGVSDYAPTNYAVYTSLDGFASALISGSLGGQVPLGQYFYNAGFTASDLTGPLEVRIVSTGRDGLPASAWLLDNIRLDVTVEALNAVPEPGTAALVAAAMLAGVGVTRRRARYSGVDASPSAPLLASA